MPYKYFLPLILLSTALLTQSAAASRLYKWTDAQGQVHYSDRLPPDEAAREREVKSNRGITLERIDAAKTRAQLDQEKQAREQDEARQRAEDELRRKQAASDRTLLLTFSSTSEIERARDDRVAAVDGQIELTRTRIDNLQNQLQQTQQQAIAAERTGRNPEKLHLRIHDMEQQLSSYEGFIKSRERERAEILDQFNADVIRYRELKAAESR